MTPNPHWLAQKGNSINFANLAILRYVPRGVPAIAELLVAVGEHD